MGRRAAQERRVFVPRKTRMRTDEWAGLLASGSAYSPHLPARLARDVIATFAGQWYLRLSSPVTAAGPRRIRTVFPILRPGHKPETTPMSAAIVTRARGLSTHESVGRLVRHFPAS
jgi:hypothetical protein